MPRILIVEDELGIRLTVGDRLLREGYQVEEAEDGRSGLRLGCQGGIDLIILDLMLPEKPGLEVCSELREAGVSTPILMLTAKGQLMDKVQGLRTGGDDYLVKPFEMLELLARIEALLRRDGEWGAPVRDRIYRFGEVVVDPKQAAVFRSGERLQLSAKEYRLLLYLVQHPKRALTRPVLLREVWQYRTELTTRTVDVHVGWLRQKIEPDPKNPRWIVTRHGVGYIFNPD